MQAAAAGVESRQETVNSQKTLWGPTISAQAVEVWGETKVDLDRSVKTPLGAMPIHINENKNFSGPRANITGTWPLFTGGKIIAEQKAGKYALDEARANQRQAFVDEDVKLIGQYFGLQLAIAVEKLRLEDLEQQNREVNRAREFEKQGMISSIERMGVEVARNKSERQWLQARDNVRVAKIELGSILHDENFGRLSTPLFIIKNPLASMKSWTEMAIANNPQIAALEAQVRQADQGSNAARANWMPEVFAFGSYSLIRHYQTMIEPTWIAGLGLNFTLWDARGRLGAYRSARANLRQAKAGHADVINQVRKDAEVAWQNTRNAMERYDLTAGDVTLAKENLQLKTRGFEEGLNTALDMTEARAQLIEAQVERKMYAYEFVVNYAILHAISGKMDDFVKNVSLKDNRLE